MGVGRNVGMGVLGGATTMAVRAVTRRALHDRRGAPKLPEPTRHRRGLTMVLAWAAAAGLVLAFADLLQEQRASTVTAS